MYVFRLIGRRFRRSRLWCGLTAAFFVLWFVMVWLTMPFDRSDTLSALGMELRLNSVFLILFSLLSYEVFFDLRASRLEECVRATTGIGSVYAAETAVLLLLNVGVTVYFSLFPLGLALCSGMPFTAELAGYIGLAALRDVFLMGALGIWLGLFAALWLNRMTGYLVIFLFILLTGPLGEMILSLPFGGTGRAPSWLYTLFLLSAQGLNWRMNYHYGYSLLPYRFAQIALWLGAFGLPIFLRFGQIAHRRGSVYRLLAILSAGMTVLGAVGMVQPGSRFEMSYAKNSSLNADENYYRTHAAAKEEAADFTVESYDLSLRVTDQLYADAVLTLSDSSAADDRRVFTLYHGFTVESVTDGTGKALPFDRKGDLLTVSGFGSAVGTLTLRYAGYHPRYYSNRQGICLPGYIAYYPLPGSRCLFDGGTVPVLPDKPAMFTVRVDSPKPVFCHLRRQEDGSFSGVSDGVTLLSGFVSETEIGGVTVIYPYLDSDQCRPEALKSETLDFLRARRAAGDTRPLNTIMIMPYINNTAAERTVRYADYISGIQIRTLADTLYADGEGER